MPNTGYVIRDAQPGDRVAWQELWAQYLVFYKADLPADHTGRLWHRILDEGDPIACTVAEVDGAVAGIANYYPHPDTWEDGPVCYLEDLYVDKSHRRNGIGKALIEDLRRRCLDNGWLRLHWDTTIDNAGARSVYDELTGGTNGFIGYEIETR